MSNDYWVECISEAADECGATLTPEQIEAIAAAAQSSHENYGMAFYSPPSSDRFAELEREHREAMKRKDREFDQYRANAERAVSEALGVPMGTTVEIGDYGEVRRIDGRHDRIQ